MQHATLTGGTGSVSFPISTKIAEAQKFFDQGLGQWHGFWNYEAERSFRQVVVLDPQCAMGYLGMGLANGNNPPRAAAFLMLANTRKPQASRREQLWIDAYAQYYADLAGDEASRRVALVQALERILAEFPTDHEARAVLVRQLWDNERRGLPIASRQAVDALAREVLAAKPNHPVHHYRIHLWSGWDDLRAMNSAAVCGALAPAIPHMWHMPGHTHSALGRYHEAIWWQQASMRVEHAYGRDRRRMPSEVEHYDHNADWLVENLVHAGRAGEALALARRLIALPRTSPHLPHGSGPMPAGAGPEALQSVLAGAHPDLHALSRARLGDLLLRLDWWDEVERLESAPDFAPSPQPEIEMQRRRVLAVAAFQRGKRQQGATHLAALRALRGELQAKMQTIEAEETALAQKTGRTVADAARQGAQAKILFEERCVRLAALIAEVEVYQALAANDPATARAALPAARELPMERRARVFAALGDKSAALADAHAATKAGPSQVPALATLAAVAEGRDADEAFQRLRTIGAGIDLTPPLLARLGSLAKRLGFNTDWRPSPTLPPPGGERPALDTLGPGEWQPWPAPTWTLPGANAASLSLADFKGRAVLLIFFLGSGCPHCVQQLNVFAPLRADFAKAGIELVAVSTDDPADLPRTFTLLKDTRPFPLVADPSLEVFKRYGCFEQYENLPAHGTFLIDGAGRVRWQNINIEPFENARWLLAESRRLLER